MSMKNSVIEGNATDCLPLEIWALIFGHAARKTSTGDDALVVSYYRDVKTLVSIMCVCRAWQVRQGGRRSRSLPDARDH
jgi:hypothetical protein